MKIYKKKPRIVINAETKFRFITTGKGLQYFRSISASTRVIKIETGQQLIYQASFKSGAKTSIACNQGQRTNSLGTLIPLLRPGSNAYFTMFT